MTPEDTFDRRLGDALRAYAADAALEPDPMAFAASVAQAHPRRRFAVAFGSSPRADQRALWPLLLLLLLGAIVGAALVGTRTQAPVVRDLDPDHPIPDELYGRWQVGGDGWYLDLNDAWLVHEADGRPAPDPGRALAFFRDAPGGIDGRVVIGSTGACGDGSYRIVLGVPPTNGPTAAPVPAGLPSPSPRPRGPLSVFDAIQFVEPVDSCAARRSILMNRTWQRMRVTLAPGATYGSLAFAEPFHMTLPLDAAAGLPNSEVGMMYQFDPHELHFSHVWWNAELIDDVPVFRDLCNHDLGTLEDIPGSVEAVGAWLQASQGLPLAPPTELVIDGRRAVRWHATDNCPNGSGPGASDLARGYEYYAIPTGDDVVLFVVRADTDNESKVAERIVLAMRFD
jgi:hypothetical protein